MKPKLFVASSVEGLELAYAVQRQLERDAVVTVWTQGIFSASVGILDNLMRTLDDVDFGVFVFSPDDLVKHRSEKQSQARNTILLEIGLFMGRLGRERVFILSPTRSEGLRLPTDLAGFTSLNYDADRADENVLASFGPACLVIGEALKHFGKAIQNPRESADSLETSKPSSSPQRPIRKLSSERVFFSYSHKDRKWIERFKTMLMPLVRSENLVVWDDSRIKPGENWRKEIKRALASSSVAILLVSPHFLASPFIANHELAPILDASKSERLTIFWVLISSCLYQATTIQNYQAAHNASQPLDTLSLPRRNEAIAKICQAIGERIGK